MLKTTKSLDKLVCEKNNNHKPAFKRNNSNSKLINLVMMIMVENTLRSQENQKAKNCLSLKNCSSWEINY